MKNIFSILSIYFISISSIAQPKNLDSLMANGEFAQVLKEAKNNNNKLSKKDQFLVAKAYISLGNTQKAVEIFQQYLEEGDAQQHFYSFGKLLLQQNQDQKADSIFSYLQKVNTTNAEYVYRSALAKQKTDKQEYKTTLYKAYDLQPDHLLVVYELAKEELKQKNYAEAIRLASHGLQIDSNNTSLLSIKGQALYAKDQWEECIATFNKLKTLTEAPLFIELRMAKAHVKLRNYPEALAHYETCIALDNTDYTLLEDAAEIATFCNESNKALLYISKAYALKDVSRARQFYILATVFLLKEDYERAIGLFNQCIDEDPTHEKATYGLANAKDRFYADKQEILNAYQLYMDNFPQGNYYDLADYRVKELRKEIFMAGE